MIPTKCTIYQALTEYCRDSEGLLPMKGTLLIVSLFLLWGFNY